MRAIWSGSISFALINIPVKLYSASESRGGIHLNMVRKSDLSPIGYKKVAKNDNQEVTFGEVVKAYEYQPGEYVEISEDDFEKANTEKTHTIDIAIFADERELDVRYFDKPYYMEPAKGAEKPYALLREALAKKKKIAVARFVLKDREHLAAIKPVDQVLVLNQMRFPSELRTPTDLKLPDAKQVKQGELDMALKLVDQLTEPFIAEDYHDTYTEELEALIDAKVKGKQPAKKGSAKTSLATKDLMASLKASLEESKSSKAKSNK
jgi:DNA end-binding protein Ku